MADAWKFKNRKMASMQSLFQLCHDRKFQPRSQGSLLPALRSVGERKIKQKTPKTKTLPNELKVV